MRLLQITSADELRSRAAAWDDLWRRSDVTLPTGRAEPLAQWLEQFSPGQQFVALVVEEAGRWIAALPLVQQRMLGMLPVGALPSNGWPGGGDLLWDAQATGDARIAQTLAEAICRLPWPLVWLDGMLPDRASWQALARGLAARGVACDERTRWQAARLLLPEEFSKLTARWSRRHRQRMASCRRRLAQRGPVHFRWLPRLSPDEVEPWLRRAYELEDRGWKGAACTSVLRSPGIFEFFVRQGRQLAAGGELALAFLECGDRPIAFCHGVVGKGVFHSCKIGYDGDYASLSPGHLLHERLLETLVAEHFTAVDAMGPMTEYHSHWRPEGYAVGRLAIAPGAALGRLALWLNRIRRSSWGRL